MEQNLKLATLQLATYESAIFASAVILQPCQGSSKLITELPIVCLLVFDFLDCSGLTNS